MKGGWKPLALAALLCPVLMGLASLAEAQNPPYELHRLGPLETPLGTLTEVCALDLNNRGQIVGRVHDNGRLDPEQQRFVSAAFLFTPGAGMLDLDPDGTYTSRAEAVNDRGEVFGRFGVSRFPSQKGQRGIFLYRRGEGHDFLDAPGQIRTTFDFRDMNTAGELVGQIFSKRRNADVPFLYSPDRGWINLLPLDPRLARTRAGAQFLNDRGEIVFGTGFDHWFVFHRDGSFVELGPFGGGDHHFIQLRERRFSKTGALVRSFEFSREITPAGFAVGRNHPELYRPRRGAIDIHPPGFKASGSAFITNRGVVGGTAQQGQARDTIFTYDERREPKLVIEVTADELFAFAGGPFGNVILFDMNNKAQFVGRLRILSRRWFFYSRETGILDLNELLAEAGGEDFVTRTAWQLNDRGQILVEAARTSGSAGGDPTTFFLLSPLAAGGE